MTCKLHVSDNLDYLKILEKYGTGPSYLYLDMETTFQNRFSPVEVWEQNETTLLKILNFLAGDLLEFIIEKNFELRWCNTEIYNEELIERLLNKSKIDLNQAFFCFENYRP